LALHRFPGPLKLLCACISAGHREQSLDPVSSAALTDPSTDLLNLARLAGRHLVTPMLAACLADPDLRRRLPHSFVLYLQFMHAENSRRNHTLRRELARAAASLNRLGIEPVLLKGAIHLVAGLYREPGWRFMRDLDLLIPRARAGEAVACLGSLGYRPIPDSDELPAQHRHLPTLGHDDTIAAIEIHTRLLDMRELLHAEEVVARSRPVDLDGARVRVPDATDQLAHLIGHDRFDPDIGGSGFFLLRSVFETALLCQDDLPLRRLLSRLGSSRLARYVGMHHALAARLFPEHVPRQSDVALDGRLLARAFVGLEQVDQDGRARRLFGYAYCQLAKLVASPAWRKHFATNVRSSDYRRHCMHRLRGLWAGD
jgi:putative nucleotidyltransferase-like protein